MNKNFQPLHIWLSALSTLALLACGQAGERALPPASGASAPPLPKLPAISSKASSISGSEGRTTGTTFAKEEAEIAPNAGGIIAELLVSEGATVKKGELLFRLDPRDATLRVQQAKAALSAAEVNLRAATVERDRAKGLLDQNAMNRAQWDATSARFEGAEVGVEGAKVAMAMAEKALSDTAVKAPFSGVVTQKLKSAGEMATMMPPTVVVVIQDQSTLELRFRLPEHALSRVKANDRLRVRFEALDLEREATIVRVQPTVDARTRTIELVAEIPNPNAELRPGLLAEVRLDQASPVLKETAAKEEARP